MIVLAVCLALAQEKAALWKGDLGAGLLEIERRCEAGESDTALAIADALLAREKDGLAATHHARGVVLARAARRPEAEQAFAAAVAHAGPGELRLDAMYDLGVLALLEGEEHRAQLPEKGGAQAPPAQAALGVPPVDPLPLARAAYLRARERLVDRLRADWTDEDTRANVELVQRRLRELEEIEKKREQQKKDEEKKKDPQPKRPPKEEDSKKGDEKKPEPDKPDEKRPEPKPDEPKPDEKKPEEQPAPQDEKKPEEKKDAQPEKAEEPVLTKEEITRLLDVLQRREMEGRELQEQLRRARRVRVRRDW